jgi:hypothetical protein
MPRRGDIPGTYCWDSKLITFINYSAGKPQSLFAKLGKKSYEQSSAEQGRTEN